MITSPVTPRASEGVLVVNRVMRVDDGRQVMSWRMVGTVQVGVIVRGEWVVGALVEGSCREQNQAGSGRVRTDRTERDRVGPGGSAHGVAAAWRFGMAAAARQCAPAHKRAGNRAPVRCELSAKGAGAWGKWVCGDSVES